MTAAKSDRSVKSGVKKSAKKVDVNTATVDELKSVRGLGKARALEIARYRDKHGAFKSLDELERVPHMGDMPWGELDEVKTHLTVRIDGEAPPIAPENEKIDVNHANIEELRAVEGIGAERAQEIIEYRDKSGGIRDLNELDDLPHFRDEPEGQRGPIKARLRV